MKLYKILLFVPLIYTSCISSRSLHYRIKKGDTIYKIANKFGTDVQSVLAANEAVIPEKILPGEIILIPKAENSQKRGLWDIFKNNSPSPYNVLQESKALNSYDDNLIDKPNRFVWPVESPVISSLYGKRGKAFHKGLDLAAKKGSSVFAADGGIVIYSDNGLKGYGNLIVIKHTKKISTIYAHNKKNLVKKGDLVKKGQKIALVGSTGNASGSHLHFEVRDGKEARNPLHYLPKRQMMSKK